MGYIQDNLMPNEKILFTARVHPAVFLPSVFSFIASIGFFAYALSTGSQGDVASGLLAGILLLTTVGFFLYSILLGIQALVIILTTEFAVTNRRVIAKRGFIRRHTLEILLPKVESISVNQNLLGRLLNFGTVTVTGTGGTRESFGVIVEPVEVRKRVTHIIERYMQSHAQSEQQAASLRSGG
ncbi:MAG: PH domain-containing protein [Oscillochloridaceae bacterium]|nr:PH domain-containing protein [Chloroflexaceae bacterium]MDW8389479.1 PH domain-containing protein [Oscillochloridaceae bacterium]